MSKDGFKFEKVSATNSYFFEKSIADQNWAVIHAFCFKNVKHFYFVEVKMFCACLLGLLLNFTKNG